MLGIQKTLVAPLCVDNGQNLDACHDKKGELKQSIGQSAKEQKATGP